MDKTDALSDAISLLGELWAITTAVLLAGDSERSEIISHRLVTLAETLRATNDHRAGLLDIWIERFETETVLFELPETLS